MPTLDLTGRRFGHLTVTGKGEPKGKKAYWSCRCECGKIVRNQAHDLLSGRVTSCGCKAVETRRKARLLAKRKEWILDAVARLQDRRDAV